MKHPLAIATNSVFCCNRTKFVYMSPKLKCHLTINLERVTFYQITGDQLSDLLLTSCSLCS